tara:strand:- start:2583 stop:2816 length:234 start_codon:yes stop_codon:yes gene_type:complete
MSQKIVADEAKQVAKAVVLWAVRAVANAVKKEGLEIVVGAVKKAANLVVKEVKPQVAQKTLVEVFLTKKETISTATA